jgi:phosphoadenosine phosphosulfate reductase
MLRWCDSCHVPVLGKRCRCGSATREVPITPPGDIRPAFPADIVHANRIFLEHFGSPLIPDGHLVLLNKVPDKDRMEEIIMGGAVVAAIRYMPDEQRWEPLPRPAAALYMKPQKRYLVVDDGAIDSILDGASVLAPGLRAIDDSVKAGDEVFILAGDGSCVGVGRAKVDASTTVTMKRGMVSRTRKNKKVQCGPGEATWDKAIWANGAILDQVEADAIRFVRDVVQKNPLPANVSYSGGKDSLATLLVVMKAIGSVPILFADTGLEFQETYENIEVVASHYGLKLIRTGSRETFNRTFESEGPPAVDARWCCKALKLLPVKRLIEECWGECLSFIGQRKYESFARKNSPRLWRNGYVKNQLSAAPIQHWTALHVWLYLFREGAPYNVLYEQRIDRIGCFLCPASDLAILDAIQEDYPDLWKPWHEQLCAWKETHALPAGWVEKGLWRCRGKGVHEDSSYT